MSMLWKILLFLPSVSSLVALDQNRHQDLSITPDGHIIMGSHSDGDSTISSQSKKLVRAEAAEKSPDDERQLIDLKRPSQGAGHHMTITNATAQLMQIMPALDSGLKCNTVIFAPADPCPFECPFLAEDAEFICHFRCLTAASCGSLDPLAKIADAQDMICRPCKVAGCADCVPGTKDTCRQCESGYSSDGNGMCTSPVEWVMFALKVLAALFAFIILAVTIELLTRKKTNWKGFKHGVAFRWRTRIHMPLNTSDEDGVNDSGDHDNAIDELLLYPLSTNLLRQPVAGAGFSLHMNFCIAVLIWSAVIIYMYAFAACMVSIDMLVLGLSPAKTSQQLCEVVHWGRDAQLRLIWAKTSFVGFAYFFTFIGSIVFGIYQHKEFHRLDDECTMGDFAGYITGLPALKGSERAEDELAKFIEQSTGQQVRGVSICWNYIDNKDLVEQAIEADWKVRELEQNPPEPEDPDNPTALQPALGFIRRQFRRIDCLVGYEKYQRPGAPEGAAAEPSTTGGDSGAEPLVPASASPAAPSTAPEPTDAEITTLLNGMESADCAFAIFNTEEARDDAVENFTKKKMAGQGVEYKGTRLTMVRKKCEPESVRFAGLAIGSFSATRVKKMSQGVVMTLVSLLVWAGVIYLPYAYYMCSFSYAHGEEPSAFAEYFFTFLVVGGNQAMYFMADWVADRANFGFEDEREIAYNYVYVAACVSNTVLDVGIMLFLSYRIMIGFGAHTADDRLVASLTDFQEIFEAYPIQKIFGELLWEYSFPACFCIPFVLEAVGTIGLPSQLQKYWLLSHDECQGRDAEKMMQYFLPMNLGRYGDVILNMILCTLVFFCPGGFTLPLFMAFFFCHACIYIYDHWRVLRCTPTFHYASSEVDTFGQLQLIIPTGILGGCFFFRLSQMYPTDVLSGALLYVVGFSQFVVQCLVHYAMVKYLVPMFAPEPHEPSTKSYADIASSHPMTWFSANPVHCLRSKFIFKDNPPNIFCINGKEHLQKANEKVGAHYEATAKGRAYKMAAKDEELEEQMNEKDAKLAAEEDI